MNKKTIDLIRRLRAARTNSTILDRLMIETIEAIETYEKKLEE